MMVRGLPALCSLCTTSLHACLGRLFDSASHGPARSSHCSGSAVYPPGGTNDRVTVRMQSRSQSVHHSPRLIPRRYYCAPPRTSDTPLSFCSCVHAVPCLLMSDASPIILRNKLSSATTAVLAIPRILMHHVTSLAVEPNMETRRSRLCDEIYP